MAWKPPADAVEWTPPEDAVAVDTLSPEEQQALTVDRMVARTQVKQTPEWWAARRNEAVLADADPLAKAPALISEPYRAVASAATSIASTVARPFSKDAADYLAKTKQDIADVGEAARADDWSPWLSRMYGGAAESLAQSGIAAATGAGAAGIIGSFALTEGNQALYDAEKAGLKGADRIKYAVIQGAIEGGVAGVLQKVAPGFSLEKFVPEIAKGVMKLSGGQFLKMTAREVPEELLTELGHAVTEAAYGIDPNATSAEQLVPRMVDTIAQTVGTLGLAQGAARLAQNRQRLDELETLRTVDSRDLKREASKLGIEGTRSQIRQKARAESKQIQKEIERAQEVQPQADEVRQEQPAPEVEAAPQAEVLDPLADARSAASDLENLYRRKGMGQPEPAGQTAPVQPPPLPPPGSGVPFTKEAWDTFGGLLPRAEAPPVDDTRVEEIIDERFAGRNGHAAQDALKERQARAQAEREAAAASVVPAAGGDIVTPPPEAVPEPVPLSPREQAQQKQGGPAEPFVMPADEIPAAKEAAAIRKNKRKGRRDQAEAVPAPQGEMHSRELNSLKRRSAEYAAKEGVTVDWESIPNEKWMIWLQSGKVPGQVLNDVLMDAPKEAVAAKREPESKSERTTRAMEGVKWFDGASASQGGVSVLTRGRFTEEQIAEADQRMKEVGFVPKAKQLDLERGARHYVEPASPPQAPIQPPEAGKRVWREMSAAELDSMVNPNTSSGETFGGTERFWSDNPDLAIGQGGNKGFKVELDPEGLKLREHAKPGTEVSGVGKEFITRNRAHEFRKGIRSIEIKPGAVGRDSDSRRVRNFLESEVNAGRWVKRDTESGGTVYSPTGVPTPPQNASEPLPAPESTQPVPTLPEASGKPEQAAKRSPPEFRDWRFTSSAKNSGKIIPNRVGRKFSEEQVQSLIAWAKSQGLEARVEGNAIKVVGGTGERLDLSMLGAVGLKREQADAAAKERKTQEGDRKQALEQKASGRESAAWIADTFGDAMNAFNRNALSDFLEGGTPKFEGIVSPQWREGLEKIGTDPGKIDWKKVKAAYEAASKPASPEQTSGETDIYRNRGRKSLRTNETSPGETDTVSESRPPQGSGEDSEAESGERFTRTTPAEGTPEREAINQRWKDYNAAYDAASDKLEKLKAEYDKTKYGTKKRDQLEAKVQKARDEKEAVDTGNDEFAKQYRITVAEDLVEGAVDEANRIAAYDLLNDRLADAGSKQRYKQGEKSYEKIKAIVKAEAERQGATPEEAEQVAVDLGGLIRNQASGKTENSVKMRVARRLESYRGQAAYRAASEELDALDDLTYGEKRDFRERLEGVKEDGERVAQIIGDAKKKDAEKKQLEEAKRVAIEAQEAAETKRRSKEAVPLEAVPTRITSAVDDNLFPAESDYWSDAKVLIDKRSLTASARETLENQPSDPRIPLDRANGLGKEALGGLSAKKPAEFIGASPNGKEFVAYFDVGGEVIGTSGADVIAWLQKNAKFDNVIHAKWNDKGVFALQKGGKTIAVVTENAETQPIDVKAMRKAVEAAQPAKSKGKKTQKQQAADAALADARDELKKLDELIRSKGLPSNPMLDPELVAGAAKVVYKYSKAAILKFEAFTERLASDISQKFVDDLLPVLKAEWNKLHATGEFEGMTDSDGNNPVVKKPAPAPDGSDLTSIKNEVVNELRAKRGVEELPEVPAQTREEWLEAAQARIAATNGTIGPSLVNEINRNPRNLSNVEVAILQLHYRAVNNAFETAAQELFTAADPTSVAVAQTRADGLLDELLTIEEATKAAGREWGRSGVARQIALNRDFSLGAMLTRARVANTGKPLTKDQTAEIAAMAKTIETLQGKLAAVEQKNAELERQKRSARLTKKETLQKRASESVKNFKEKWAALYRTSIVSDPKADAEKWAQITTAAVDVVKAYVDLGVFSFTEFMDRVRADIGDEFADEAEEALQKAWDDLDPSSPRYTASLKRRIADYSQRPADFEQPKKEPRKLSREELDLKRELEDAKQEFFKRVGQYRLDNLTGWERALDYARETAHLSRALMTSFDMSAVFRQGGPAVFAHPRLGLKAGKQMLQAAFSRQAEFDSAEEIRNRPNGQLYETARLALTDNEEKITRQEEAFMGRWAKKIGPVRGSARAYTAFLNNLRADLFDAMVENVGRSGAVTLEEAKVIARFVNVATGRSDLGKFNAAAANLNTVFFAPRYVMSRFQYLAMPFTLPFSKTSGRVKKAIAMEYARHATGVAAFMGAVVVLGALLTDDDDEEPTVELDPRSSDFLKIKIGETRIDPMSGLSQAMVLLAKTATGKKKTGSGKVVDLIGDDVPYGGSTWIGEVGRFLWSKTAPVISSGIELRTGEDFVGEKTTPLGTVSRMFLPLSFQEVRDTMVARGIPQGTAVSALALLGMGASTYGPRTDYLTGTEPERQEQFAKFLKGIDWDTEDPPYSELLTEEQRQKIDARREERKQSVVLDATNNPQRKDAKSDESFAESLAELEKAKATLQETGWTYEEAKQLLNDSDLKKKADRHERLKRIYGVE